MKLIGNVQLVAGGNSMIPTVLCLLEEQGIVIEGNPDLYARAYGTLGIDEAREVGAKAALRAFGAQRRIFVLSADSITAEAQNALLKTLEESSGDALFFFIVPAPSQLLATVRSRSQILSLSRSSDTSTRAASFVASAPSKRLDLLKPLLEKGESDKRDLGEILTFLEELERCLADDVHKKSAREGLWAVMRARKFISDRGALAKPLLEQIALLA